MSVTIYCERDALNNSTTDAADRRNSEADVCVNIPVFRPPITAPSGRSSSLPLDYRYQRTSPQCIFISPSPTARTAVESKLCVIVSFVENLTLFRRGAALTMDTPKKNNDCYFYYYSSCLKGDGCMFRHEPSALGCETMCSFWQQGKCLNTRCNFRHMELRKNRKMIPCYWENQPMGCRKQHCPFLHKSPRRGPREPGGPRSQQRLTVLWKSLDKLGVPGNLKQIEEGGSKWSDQRNALYLLLIPRYTRVTRRFGEKYRDDWIKDTERERERESNEDMREKLGVKESMVEGVRSLRLVVVESGSYEESMGNTDLDTTRLGPRRVSQGGEAGYGSPPVDPLVVNFEEESDTESAPTSTPTKLTAVVKTLEQIRLERVQAEQAALYNYESEDSSDLRARLRRLLAPRLTELAPMYMDRQDNLNINQIVVKTLQQIRAEKGIDTSDSPEKSPSRKRSHSPVMFSASTEPKQNHKVLKTSIDTLLAGEKPQIDTDTNAVSIATQPIRLRRHRGVAAALPRSRPVRLRRNMVRLANESSEHNADSSNDNSVVSSSNDTVSIFPDISNNTTMDTSNDNTVESSNVMDQEAGMRMESPAYEKHFNDTQLCSSTVGKDLFHSSLAANGRKTEHRRETLEEDEMLSGIYEPDLMEADILQDIDELLKD
uniref:(California timema) hypothetical protein n=1 Tax=Timema californicum TaxID=61474 RepID=A0A7R9J8V9_TIMCA|nr:unnamed protein product [Timema californicum]